MTDYTELKRLAEAATPGPWHWVNPRDDSAWDGTGVASLRTTQEFGKNERKEIDGKFYTSFALPKFVASWAEIDEPADAAYIAAASPDVVLSMIAEIEETKRLRDEWKREAQELLIERDRLRTQNQALVKEMQYIAGISNGQVKRVADQVLAALALTKEQQ